MRDSIAFYDFTSYCQIGCNKKHLLGIIDGPQLDGFFFIQSGEGGLRQD